MCKNIKIHKNKKIPFSLQGEMNLVQEEEQNKEGQNQKNVSKKMLNKLSKDKY
jgi:hypothetical protein